MAHPVAGADGIERDDPGAHPGGEGHDEHEDDGYAGPATLEVDTGDGEPRRLDVRVRLVGHLEPLDGRFRWYGRVAAHPELDALLDGHRATARVVTPQGHATGELSDVDPWGRYRLSGQSTPPFAVGLA